MGSSETLENQGLKAMFFPAMSVFLFVSQCVSHIIFDNFLGARTGHCLVHAYGDLIKM